MLYIIGALIEALAALPSLGSTTGLTILIVGRWTYGIACGFAMHGAPTYIGEMAPASIRGLLVSLKEGMIVLGILAGYLVGFLLRHRAGAWALTYGVSVVPALAMGCGAYALPPSARWLVLRAQRSPDEASMLEQRALASLRFVFNDDTVAESALAEIKTQCASSDEEEHADGGSGGVFSARYRPALVAGLGVVLLQQLTGQPSVLYCTLCGRRSNPALTRGTARATPPFLFRSDANTIFDDVGIADAATVGTGAFKLVATLTTTVPPFALTLSSISLSNRSLDPNSLSGRRRSSIGTGGGPFSSSASP